jgi:hypothetical protein
VCAVGAILHRIGSDQAANRKLSGTEQAVSGLIDLSKLLLRLSPPWLSSVQTLDRRSSLLHTGVVSSHSCRMRQAILLCQRESAHRVCVCVRISCVAVVCGVCVQSGMCACDSEIDQHARGQLLSLQLNQSFCLCAASFDSTERMNGRELTVSMM